MRGFAVSCTALVLAFFAVAQEKRAGADGKKYDDGDSQVEKQIREILAADNPFELDFISPLKGKPNYRSLFDSAGRAGIRRLVCHDHDSIAIQAAWEEVALTVAEGQLPTTARPDQQKLNWFVGFLEARARVRAPEWWREAVLEACANSRRNIYVPGPKRDFYRRSELEWCRTPTDTTLCKADEEIVLRVGSDTIRLPKDILTHQGMHCDGASALFTPSRCYLAVHDDWGYPYKLTCLDRSSAKTVWTADAWGSCWHVATGKSHAWVSVVERGNRVFVFGAAGGIHVEAFRSENGTNLFRFASTY
jgi:hypothetical protein